MKRRSFPAVVAPSTFAIFACLLPSRMFGQSDSVWPETYGTTQALSKAGRLRYVAVIGAKRLAAYPDVPTMRESGGPAELEAIGWTALAAPTAIPLAVAEKIRRDLAKVLAEPDIAQRYATFGYEPFSVTNERFRAQIVGESARFAEIIRKAKISFD
jgi:tripartite-type tricarboxylate transporter receptor subunit TctC